MKIITTLLLAAGLFLTAGLSAKVENGQAAPDFSLQGHDGKTHSIASHKGKYVVLEWVNHGCPYVQRHYKKGNMQGTQKSLTSEGVVWYSISTSGPGKQGYMDAAAAKKIVEEKKASPTAVLFDDDGKIGRLYDAKTTPHMYVIAPDGKLIYQGAIDSNRNSTNADDNDKATNYVRQAIAEHKAGKAVSVAKTDAYGCGIKY